MATSPISIASGPGDISVILGAAYRPLPRRFCDACPGRCCVCLVITWVSK